MKQNFISAKQDFDNYLQTNLTGKPKATQDSITAKESQIKEILKDSNDKMHLTNHEKNDSNQHEIYSNNSETSVPFAQEEESLQEEIGENSISSVKAD